MIILIKLADKISLAELFLGRLISRYNVARSNKVLNLCVR